MNNDRKEFMKLPEQLLISLNLAGDNIATFSTSERKRERERGEKVVYFSVYYNISGHKELPLLCCLFLSFSSELL